MNYGESRARERRWNNTEQCPERKLMRAIERRQKYPTNWLWRLQNFPSMFQNSRNVVLCSRARKVTWFGQVMNKRNQTCLSVKRNYKTVNTAEKSGWFVDLSKRLVQFSLHNFCCKFLPARKIYTDRDELPTCDKWLLLWRCTLPQETGSRARRHWVHMARNSISKNQRSSYWNYLSPSRFVKTSLSRF